MSKSKFTDSQIIIRRVFIVQAIMLCILVVLFIIAFFSPSGRLWSFPISFVVGGIGASVGQLRRLPGQNQEVQKHIASSKSVTMMHVLYGGIMAAVAYLLFMGGILTGEIGKGMLTTNLFPDFNGTQTSGSEANAVNEILGSKTVAEVGGSKKSDKDGIDNSTLSLRRILQIRPNTIRDFAKLLIWCFLAGYSENLIGKLLESLEKGISGN
jgi:hypothetical protein